MKVQVEFYTERKADERHLRFSAEAKSYIVEAVLDQWFAGMIKLY